MACAMIGKRGKRFGKNAIIGYKYVLAHIFYTSNFLYFFKNIYIHHSVPT